MSNLRLTLPRNQLGRDFVVGDLHGCLTQLRVALARTSFDTSRDRLICVGDLTDRGENSLGVLSLLMQPWFFAVRGNHDDMLLTAMGLFNSPVHTRQDFYRNGGHWTLELSSDQKKRLTAAANLLMGMPHIITLQKEDGAPLCHITHAQMALEGRDLDYDAELLTDAALQSRSESIDISVQDRDWWVASLTWSRGLAREALGHLAGSQKHQITAGELILTTTTPWEHGLSPVFCGHSVMPYAMLHRSHIFIDRGAFKARGNEQRLLVLPIEETLQELLTLAPRAQEETTLQG